MNNQEKEISHKEKVYGIKNTEYEITYYSVRTLKNNYGRPSLTQHLRNGCNGIQTIFGKIDNFAPPTVCVRSEEGLHILDLNQIIEMHPLLEDEE